LGGDGITGGGTVFPAGATFGCSLLLHPALTTTNSNSADTAPRSAAGDVMREVSSGLAIAPFCTEVRMPRA